MSATGFGRRSPTGLRRLLPGVRPALITVGMFAFLAAWNDFLAPLILINDTNSETLPVAISNLRTEDSDLELVWRVLRREAAALNLP